MRGRIITFLLFFCLTLSGCSALLSRSYTTVTPHSATPKAEGDPTTLRVESHQELVNALIYLISQGDETGTIRLYNYEDDVDAALDDACQEVIQEDPLGAYAVDAIRYQITPIVAYCEADVQITYRRTHEQVAAIVAATGATSIRSQLMEVMSTFGEEVALRISYFEGDEAYIHTLIRQAYYDIPEAALDLPDAQVTIYPASGQPRIVEIQLTYHLQRRELERRRTALARKVNELAVALWDARGDAGIQRVAAEILAAGQYDATGGSSAYHALLEGTADSQGLSLAAALLYQRLGWTSQVVEGLQNGEPHYWTIVLTDQGYRHLDLTQEPLEDQFALMEDWEITQLGYHWDTLALPQCGEQTAPSEALVKDP